MRRVARSRAGAAPNSPNSRTRGANGRSPTSEAAASPRQSTADPCHRLAATLGQRAGLVAGRVVSGLAVPDQRDAHPPRPAVT